MFKFAPRRLTAEHVVAAAAAGQQPPARTTKGDSMNHKVSCYPSPTLRKKFGLDLEKVKSLQEPAGGCGCEGYHPSGICLPPSIAQEGIKGTHALWPASCVSQSLVSKAYEEAEALMVALWPGELGTGTTPQVPPEMEPFLTASKLDVLRKWYRPQPAQYKAQLQMPFSHEGGIHGGLQQLLPPHLHEVLVIFVMLALQYVESMVRCLVPSLVDNGLIDALHKKSVFRVWWYGAESNTGTSSSCRQHHDPGLCTLLPFGSRRGLQLLDPVQNDWVAAETLLEQKLASEGGAASTKADGGVPLLLLNNTLLRGATSNEVDHCLHRVVPWRMAAQDSVKSSDTTTAGSPGGVDTPTGTTIATGRLNLVLELRPEHNNWYAYQLPDGERAALKQAKKEGWLVL